MRKLLQALGLGSWDALVFTHRAQGFVLGVLAVGALVLFSSCGGGAR